MDLEEFKDACTEVIDYIADYRDTMSKRPVLPEAEPGFLRDSIPGEAPETGTNWKELMFNLDEKVVPILENWIHPHFHSYFPLGGSNISVLGLMLCQAINSSSNKWSMCPASIELEMAILDWVAKLYSIPEKFHFYKEGSKGGAVLQGSASECSLMSLYAAQRVSLEKQREKDPGKSDGELLSLQMAYISKEAHSDIQKDCQIALVNVRVLDVDEKFRFRGETLEQAVQDDIKKGLYPFYCVASFGTMSCAAVDKIGELGPICKKYDMWFHIYGPYSLAALSCPEFKDLLEGFECVTSITTNPCKWLLIHYDYNVMWLKDHQKFASLISDSSVTYNYPNTPIIDYKTWSISHTLRFRSLQMWFVLRAYGVEGIQRYIRNHIALANCFDKLVRSDNRFEVIIRNFGTVCFRLKGPNKNTKALLLAITATQKLFMSSAILAGRYVIRFSVDKENAKEEHIAYAWEIIRSIADRLILASQSTNDTEVQDEKQEETK